MVTRKGEPQYKPYGTTPDDKKFRARRVRLAFFTLYRNFHAWVAAEDLKAKSAALVEMHRAHRDLQSHKVALEDRGEEELV